MTDDGESYIHVPIPLTNRELKLKSAGKVFCFGVICIPAIVTALRGAEPTVVLSWTLFTAVIGLPIMRYIHEQKVFRKRTSEGQVRMNAPLHDAQDAE